MTTGVVSPVNKLLARLPLDDYRRIERELDLVPLHHRSTIIHTSESTRKIYFPRGGACAVIRTTPDGQVAGVAAVGNEGFIGFSAITGDRDSGETAVVEIGEADAYAMDATVFLREMRRHDAFETAIHRYVHAFVETLMQSIACNALHSVERRCARALLEIADRIGSPDLPLTQQFLATLLGVRRPTVTLAVGTLHRAGAIQYRRRQIVVSDAARLQSLSCDCYAVTKRRFETLAI
jgi:CRP-like cAMP-binding protein